MQIKKCHALTTALTTFALALSACPDDATNADAGVSADAADDVSVADAADTPDAGLADAGVAVDAGQQEAELHARFIVTNQRVFREDALFAQGGIAVFEIYDPQDLPADDRSEYFNGDGERCTLESGSEWPQLLANGDTWPEGPFKNGGTLSLVVDGAPGNVDYDYFDSYYLRESPGPVEIGDVTHNSFFSPEYIPHGASATFSSAGGPDLPSFSIDNLTLANDYVVVSPALEAGGDLIDNGEALVFNWTPGDDDSEMFVIVKSGFNFLKCAFADDGEAEVPAQAMGFLSGGQFATFTIQTWRERTTKHQIVAEDGTTIDASFTSRHVQIGRFDGL